MTVILCRGWGTLVPQSSGLCQEVALTNPRLLWAPPPLWGCSWQVGHPQPNVSMTQGAPVEPRVVAHPAPPPCPPWRGQAHRELGLSQRRGREVGAEFTPQQVPRMVARDQAVVPKAAHPHSHPCQASSPLGDSAAAAPVPPADLGEPLTTPGWAPGSKLHVRPHPSSRNVPRCQSHRCTAPGQRSSAARTTTASYGSSCATRASFFWENNPKSACRPERCLG